MGAQQSAMLQEACGSNADLNKVTEMVMRGVNVNLCVTKTGTTALHTAVAFNQPAIVMFLLTNRKSAANPMQADVYQSTPLHKAAELGHLNMLQMLCSMTQFDLDINVVDAAGFTPVMRAASRGRVDVVQWLVLVGKADISLVNKNGDNALMLAAECGCIETAQFLTRQGVDLKVKNEAGMSVFKITPKRQGVRRAAMVQAIMEIVNERKAGFGNSSPSGTTGTSLSRGTTVLITDNTQGDIQEDEDIGGVSPARSGRRAQPSMPALSQLFIASPNGGQVLGTTKGLTASESNMVRSLSIGVNARQVKSGRKILRAGTARFANAKAASSSSGSSPSPRPRSVRFQRYNTTFDTAMTHSAMEEVDGKLDDAKHRRQGSGAYSPPPSSAKPRKSALGRKRKSATLEPPSLDVDDVIDEDADDTEPEDWGDEVPTPTAESAIPMPAFSSSADLEQVESPRPSPKDQNPFMRNTKSNNARMFRRKTFRQRDLNEQRNHILAQMNTCKDKMKHLEADLADVDMKIRALEMAREHSMRKRQERKEKLYGTGDSTDKKATTKKKKGKGKKKKDKVLEFLRFKRRKSARTPK